MKFPSLSRVTRCLAAASVVLACLGAAPTVAHATTYTVKSNLDTDGTTCGATNCTLRQAMNAAELNVGADNIVFDATVFGSSKQTINLSNVLPDVQHDVTITGPSTAGAGVTLAGTSIINDMSVSAGTLTLANLNVTAATTANGLSISAGGTAIVTACTFNNNRNGISSFGTVTVKNSTIAGNNNNGIFVGSGCTATLESDTITTNGTGINLNNGDNNPNVTLKNVLSVGNGSGTNDNANLFGIAADNGNNTRTGLAATAGLSATGLTDNGGPTQTVALVQGGSAIDSGSTTLTVDQRGIARPQGSAADRGAYEFVPPPQSGPAFVVKSNDDTDGTSCGANDCTLRQAINAANADGVDSTITFDATVFGSSKQTITLTQGNLPVFTSNVTLTGPSTTGAGVTLQNTNSSSGSTLSVSSGTIILSNLTLSGGFGGFYASGTTTNATVNSCTFSNNYYGLFNAFNATIGFTVNNCTCVNNTQYGLFNQTATATVNSCTFTGNNIGLAISGGTVNLTNSLVVGNTTNVQGGMLNSDHSTTTGTPTSAGLQVDGMGNAVLDDNGGPTKTVALVVGGAAVDTGSTTLTTDQRGFTRPSGPAKDKGAYELVNNNTAPTISSVTITPNTPKTNDTLTANVTASDAQSNPIIYTYVWKKNGTTIAGETNSTLDLSKMGNGDKGDQITVTVTANDGQLDSTPFTSSAVTVQNSAPVVTVSITPNTPFTNDTLTLNLDSITDPDGDTVTPTYQWKKNGSNITGETGATLNLATAGNGDKGDSITVVVTAFDGTNSSVTESSPVVVKNSTPVISSVTITPTNPGTNSTLTANVTASDADVDTINKSYIWKKNGTVIAGQTSSTLDLSVAGNGDKGDQITVTATVDDGVNSSAGTTSDPVTIGNAAPTISAVTIMPNNPTTNSTLTANVTASDPDSDTLTYIYVWKKNGTTIVGETGNTLNLATAGNGDKGDQITVTVTANDGAANSSAVTSSAVTVGNSAPSITSVTITPNNPTTNSTLTANVVATDADSADTVTYTYQWSKNGTPLAGETGSTLDLSVAGNGDKGDVVRVTAVVHDGTANSAGMTSTGVTIGNSAPVISSVTITPNNPGTNDTLTANVTASDADGTTPTYSYVWKKNGTTIAGETGSTLNLATAGNGDNGDQITVTVVASDGTDMSAPMTSSAVTVGNTAPVISSVTITPNNPTTTSTLTANVVASDADNNTLTYSYVWKKNGTVIAGETGQTLNLATAGNGDKGDQITVTVTANDGTANSAAVTSSAVTVGNTSPSITSVTITPINPGTNATLTATVVATDADNDTLTYSYAWKKNGTTIAGETGSTLDLSVAGNGSKGDQITITVTANDGSANSSAVTSDPVTIGNTAPVISSVTITPNNPSTTATITANVTASDADNDSLTYSYVWKKNGTVIAGETGSTLNLATAGNGDNGDLITVTVTANDGSADSAPVTSASVEVGNTAPVVTVASITPQHPLTYVRLTAIAQGTDADNDSVTFTYQWNKNGTPIVGQTSSTLDLSVPGNGDDGDVITVTITALDATSASVPVTSAPVTVGDLAPVVVSVTPQGATDKVNDKRTFVVTAKDDNGAPDIAQLSLLINTSLDPSGGALLTYKPNATSPTNGQLFLRQGDRVLPPMTVGTGASASDYLDNGAVHIVGTDVTVTVGSDGRTLSVSIPATVREGLIGTDTLFTRVQDVAGATDAAAQSGDQGYVRFGPYTVTSQFVNPTNSAPTLSDLTPKVTNTTLNASGIAPNAQSFGFFFKDQDGTSDIQEVWFLAGNHEGWAHSATFVYYPRTRRLVLRSDDGSTFLGGGRIGDPGIIENSQVRVDLSKVKVLIYNDGKSLGLSLPLQGKTGLLGQNNIWLRVQDSHGATSPDGDAQGFVLKGSWDIKKATAGDPKPSGGTS